MRRHWDSAASPDGPIGIAAPPSSRRPLASRVVSVGALVLLLVAFLAVAPSAEALTQRPFKEVFGSAAQPNVESGGLRIELRSGDVLIAVTEPRDVSRFSIQRFHADGTPAPFSRLGTNVIDGKEANGKECAEEPASCDKTPQNEAFTATSSASDIAIDESGGVADGDIYVAEPHRVDIFASDGTYLGQLTGYLDDPFEEIGNSAESVVVGPTGEVVVNSGDRIFGFVPTGNPVTNDDGVFRNNLPSGQGGLIAATFGVGATAKSIFAVGTVPRAEQATGNGIYQFSGVDGSLERIFAEGEVADLRRIGMDPQSGTLLFQGSRSSLIEYEVASSSTPVRLGGLVIDYNRSQSAKEIEGFAINNRGEAIVSERSRGGTTPYSLGVYGEPVQVPRVAVEPPSGVTGSRAIFSGTIDPENIPLKECFFEYGVASGVGKGATLPENPSTVPCEGPLPPTDSEPHLVQAEVSGLEPNGVIYKFRLVAVATNDGREESAEEELTTAPTVVTLSAAPISTTEATLNGLVRPESESEKFSACYFEYGLGNAGFERRAPCTPRAGEVPGGFSPQPVGAAISGLQPATTYHYKLVATSPKRGVREGAELTFTTHGPPRITELAALDADQSSVTLEAKVNPSGFATSYRFEWGPTALYGNRVPADFEPNLGEGESPVRVTARLSSLAAGTIYHYRVIASSLAGEVASPDQLAETLNSCGLPEGRCYELVSRAAPGPVALPGYVQTNAELGYQVDPRGGAVTYPTEFGYPDARKGYEVLYRAVRGQTNWQSTELSPPFVAQSEKNGGGSEGGAINWLSDDLSCGFLTSPQPLTDDASARQVIERGGVNFYRLNPDGSYTIVTRQAPENIMSNGEYAFVGASQDCGMVVFETSYVYPGVPVADPEATSERAHHLYVWSNGDLRELTGDRFSAIFGGATGDETNVVSEDGSRIFLPNGTLVEGESTRRYDGGAEARQYCWANRDGSRVFFTAAAGLTAEASGAGGPEGTDLYEYDVETETLTDRTVVHAAGGAQVNGFVAATEDGSVLYFGSRARLLPGRGPTTEENTRDETNSIYRVSGGHLEYVGTTNEGSGTYLVSTNSWSSQISPDGRYLAFASTSNVTGYESGGQSEAYLFDSTGNQGSGATTCVSCRRDGRPSEEPTSQVLPVGRVETNNEFHHPQFLIVRDGEPRLFFVSVDALAPGATAGRPNVYEWVHGQVFRLGSSAGRAIFGGASADGTDAYLTTTENLSSEDQDGRYSVFDARIGGGFPQVSPPVACVPTLENSCQAPPQVGSGAPAVATAGDSGGRNLEPKKNCVKTKKKKCPSKKHGKRKRGGKAGKGKKKPARDSGGHGRAGK